MRKYTHTPIRIDAPEMPDHCRKGRRCTPGNPFKSKDYLESLTRGTVTCTAIEIDHYGRTIAPAPQKEKTFPARWLRLDTPLRDMVALIANSAKYTRSGTFWPEPA